MEVLGFFQMGFSFIKNRAQTADHPVGLDAIIFHQFARNRSAMKVFYLGSSDDGVTD